MKKKEKENKLPPQEQQQQPGKEHQMTPKPDYESKISDARLAGKVAVITGGDSGIGRAIAVAFAKEGAHVVISYLNEKKDAEETKVEVEKYDVNCFLISGDISKPAQSQKIVDKAIREFGKIDILINNAAVQYPQKGIEDIDNEQLLETFKVNVFSMFYLVKAALPHLKDGASIINTASVTAYRGNPKLIDYSSTKGAIVSFTRALSASLVKNGIRVNAVAPGPIWTPLIPSTFSKEEVEKFGSDTPMGRVGQPNEVAACYVFLASDEASYISGQTLHPNGGESLNG